MNIQLASRISTVKKYFFASKLEEIRRMDVAGDRVINLGIGNPDISPNNEVTKELVYSAFQQRSHTYQPYQGRSELRTAFAEWYLRIYNVDLKPDKEVLPLMGSKEGIMHISLAFLEPGDTVLIPNPGYPAYASAARMAGANVCYYNLKAENNWFPDFDELERRADDTCKLIWVNYPHMPTGKNGNIKLYQKLVEFANKKGILLCHDNPYSLILNDTPMSILNAEGAKECTLELNSLSKSHNMAGWRVGVLIGNEDLVSSVLRVKSNFDSGMYRPVQEAAIKALQLGSEWYKALNEVYKVRRTNVLKITRMLNCKTDQEAAGMFVWARIPDTYSNGVELSDYLLKEAKVFITPGSVFGKNGEKYIRISLCAPDQKIEEAYCRIKCLVMSD